MATIECLCCKHEKYGCSEGVDFMQYELKKDPTNNRFQTK
jgi:hypothetical protein